jgi:uncharacterized protein involved in response to NO
VLGWVGLFWCLLTRAILRGASLVRGRVLPVALPIVNMPGTFRNVSEMVDKMEVVFVVVARCGWVVGFCAGSG